MNTKKIPSIGGVGLAAGALACAGLLSAGAAVSRAATYYTPDFNGPLTLSNTAGPGVWYTDRAAPGGFTASGGILSETTDPNQTIAAGHYYTIQGRDYETNLVGGSPTIAVQLYLPTSWSTPATNAATSEAAGLWSEGLTSGGSYVGAYPIISFINDPHYVTINNAAGYTGTTQPGFYVYTNGTGTGYYTDFTYVPGAVFGAWNTLSYTVNVGTGVSYYLNGVNVYNNADTQTAELADASLQVNNYGVAYTAQWAAVTPVPGSLGLVGVGSLALIGGLALRRRMAKLQ